MTREEGVWLWLDRSRGIGPGRARQLLDYFGGEEALWEADVEEIAQAVGRQVAAVQNNVNADMVRYTQGVMR